jgi:hypothetical protein
MRKQALMGVIFCLLYQQPLCSDERYLPRPILLEELDDPPPISPLQQLCQNIQAAIERAGTPLAIADWLNAMQFPSFYETTFHTLLSQEKYFTAINSLGQYNLAIEPYGFTSNFKLKGEDFKLQTMGLAASGNMTFNDTWVLGVGLGYGHSNCGLGHKKKETKINSLYFGPQATYLLNNGYVQLVLAGVYNMYSVPDEFIAQLTTSNEHASWNILGKLSGGYDFTIPFFGYGTFFLTPKADVSYLGVLKEAYEEQGANGLKVSIKENYQNFLRSRLILQFWREFFQKELGFLIPSLSFGWINMQPISSGEIKLGCDEEHTIKTQKYPVSNQLYLGAKLTAIHYKGYLLGLSFDANVAEVYPIYMGALRFEVDW